jgi:anti-anti-sigma factor
VVDVRINMSHSEIGNGHEGEPRRIPFHHLEAAVSCTDYLHVQENLSYPGVHVVSLEGELDAFVAPYVVDRLSKMGGSTLQVDLSQLKLIDGGGVGALLEVKELMEQQGHKFRVRGAQGIVRRVFEVLHFEEWLE